MYTFSWQKIAKNSTCEKVSFIRFPKNCSGLHGEEQHRQHVFGRHQPKHLSPISGCGRSNPAGRQIRSDSARHEVGCHRNGSEQKVFHRSDVESGGIQRL